MEKTLEELFQENEYQIEHILAKTMEELINNIAVSKRMVINKKFKFKHLQPYARTETGCLGFIAGMEWAFTLLEREKRKVGK